MSRRDPPPCDEAFKWLKNREWNLGVCTGQDYPALAAVAHCWKLWGRSDHEGRTAAIGAIASLLCGMQEACWPMAHELAAQALDWGHRYDLWPQVVEAFRKLDPEPEPGAADRLARVHEHPLVRRPYSTGRHS